MSGLNEQTKRKIALLAGDDLQEEDLDEVRSLVESSPQCQGHWVRIRGCLDVLGRSDFPQTSDVAGGLWRDVQTRMNTASANGTRSRQFNGWVPALSMAAACVALLVAGQVDRSWHSRPGDWTRAAAAQLTDGASGVRWMPFDTELARPDRPYFPRGTAAGTQLIEQYAEPVPLRRERARDPNLRIDEQRVPMPYWR